MSRFVNTDDREISAALESDIVADLSQLQGEPCIYQKYRRFVVIKSIRDTHIPNEYKGVRAIFPQNFSPFLRSLRVNVTVRMVDRERVGFPRPLL